jgi:hypothetical protein
MILEFSVCYGGGMQATKVEPQYDNIVCDIDHTAMQLVTVSHGKLP